MRVVQIVLDKKLLHAADQAAKRTRRNRSALVREALREYLRRLELRASEVRDRQGYSRQSSATRKRGVGKSEATWPEDIARGEVRLYQFAAPDKETTGLVLNPPTAPSPIYPRSRWRLSPLPIRVCAIGSRSE